MLLFDNVWLIRALNSSSGRDQLIYNPWIWWLIVEVHPCSQLFWSDVRVLEFGYQTLSSTREWTKSYPPISICQTLITALFQSPNSLGNSLPMQWHASLSSWTLNALELLTFTSQCDVYSLHNWISPSLTFVSTVCLANWYCSRYLQWSTRISIVL
jgi:hypothetical protein